MCNASFFTVLLVLGELSARRWLGAKWRQGKVCPWLLLSSLSTFQVLRDVPGDSGVPSTREMVPEVRQSSPCSSLALAEGSLTAAQPQLPSRTDLNCWREPSAPCSPCTRQLSSSRSASDGSRECQVLSWARAVPGLPLFVPVPVPHWARAMCSDTLPCLGVQEQLGEHCTPRA